MLYSKNWIFELKCSSATFLFSEYSSSGYNELEDIKARTQMDYLTQCKTHPQAKMIEKTKRFSANRLRVDQVAE